MKIANNAEDEGESLIIDYDLSEEEEDKESSVILISYSNLIIFRVKLQDVLITNANYKCFDLNEINISHADFAMMIFGIKILKKSRSIIISIDSMFSKWNEFFERMNKIPQIVELIEV